MHWYLWIYLAQEAHCTLSPQPLLLIQLWDWDGGHSICSGQRHNLPLQTEPSLGCPHRVSSPGINPVHHTPHPRCSPQPPSSPSHLLCSDPGQVMVISCLDPCNISLSSSASTFQQDFQKFKSGMSPLSLQALNGYLWLAGSSPHCLSSILGLLFCSCQSCWPHLLPL